MTEASAGGVQSTEPDLMSPFGLGPESFPDAPRLFELNFS
jgi:hypothetical protein